MNLRQLMGMTDPKPKLDEWELMARRVIRQLTLMGYSAYEVWEISAEMERLTLDSQSHPDLFPPNQRPLKLQSFTVR